MRIRHWILLTSALLFVGAPAFAAPTLVIVEDPTLGAPARHGLDTFEAAVRARGWKITHADSAEHAKSDRIVLISHGGKRLPTPEALAIDKFTLDGKPALRLSGADDRGLMYALLEAAASIAADSRDIFDAVREVEESPTIRDRALSVYTMNRAHWESRFYDEAYWRRYFDMLAADRFNRFTIIFGYENGGFLAPPYPYLFDTPGFANVRMVGLTRKQQRRNLAALKRIIELAHERGIDVTLGIWDHIYRGGVQAGGADWVDEYKGRPIPNSVTGVTGDNLSTYTLAALRELLVQVPAVDGLQLRVHEESGLHPAEMVEFWRAVFENLHATKPGMRVELRGKNTPDAVIDERTRPRHRSAHRDQILDGTDGPALPSRARQSTQSARPACRIRGFPALSAAVPDDLATLERRHFARAAVGRSGVRAPLRCVRGALRQPKLGRAGAARHEDGSAAS